MPSFSWFPKFSPWIVFSPREQRGKWIRASPGAKLGEHVPSVNQKKVTSVNSRLWEWDARRWVSVGKRSNTIPITLNPRGRGGNLFILCIRVYRLNILLWSKNMLKWASRRECENGMQEAGCCSQAFQYYTHYSQRTGEFIYPMYACL